MLQRARIRRAAERVQNRRIPPPTPSVDTPPDAGGLPSASADFSIATVSVLPEVTPVARKIQRQESDDGHPAAAPTPAPPANPPGDGAEELKADGRGSTTILAPTVSFKIYGGKTLQDVSNARERDGLPGTLAAWGRHADVEPSAVAPAPAIGHAFGELPESRHDRRRA